MSRDIVQIVLSEFEGNIVERLDVTDSDITNLEELTERLESFVTSNLSSMYVLFVKNNIIFSTNEVDLAIKDILRIKIKNITGMISYEEAKRMWRLVLIPLYHREN